MKQTTDELKSIIAHAPYGATHANGKGCYCKFVGSEMLNWFDMRGEWIKPYKVPQPLRSLSDIKEIIELREKQGL